MEPLHQALVTGSEQYLMESPRLRIHSFCFLRAIEVPRNGVLRSGECTSMGLSHELPQVHELWERCSHRVDAIDSMKLPKEADFLAPEVW